MSLVLMGWLQSKYHQPAIWKLLDAKYGFNPPSGSEAVPPSSIQVHMAVPWDPTIKRIPIVVT